MIRAIRMAACIFALATTAVATPAFSQASEPTFAELLAKAHAQVAAGHRWAPAGDNVSETFSEMIDRLHTATPEQVAEFEAMLGKAQEEAESGTTKLAREQEAARQQRLGAASIDGPATDQPAPVQPPSAGGEAARVLPWPAKSDPMRVQQRAAGDGATPAQPRPAQDNTASLAVPAPDDAAVAQPPAADKAASAEPPRAVADKAASAEPPRAVADETASVPSRPAAVEAPPAQPRVASISPAQPPMDRPESAASQTARSMTAMASPPLSEAPAVRGIQEQWPQPAATPPAKPQPQSQVQPQTLAPYAEDLYQRGRAAEKQGDISGARRFYAAAAQGGHAAAAQAAGRLYDPAVLKGKVVGGIDADASTARHWYDRAAQLGFPGANNSTVSVK